MISADACTWKLDDPVLAAEELAEQINAKLTLQKNSVGLLFSDSGVDHERLLAELRKRFDFEITGCTSMGMLSSESGYEEFCVTLLVLSGDDCHFHVECSESITKENAREVITSAYQAGAAVLGGEPRLVFALAPYHDEVCLDSYPDIIGEVSHGVPVFGGIPSANLGERELVLAKGGAHRDRMALLFIGGDVRPHFRTCNLFDNVALQKRMITRAKDNVLYRVGEQTFLEYAESLGLHFDFEDDETLAFVFLAHPLLIEDRSRNTDGVPFVRTIGGVNKRDGSATLLGNVPQDALVSVGVLHKEGIERSAEIGVEEIRQIIAESETEDYRYSTVLCVSCIGRSMVMAPSVEQEGRLIRLGLPQRYNIFGFYAWGEICPTSAGREGARNRGHHETLSICAL